MANKNRAALGNAALVRSELLEKLYASARE
jgi:hypothetical protein